MEKIESLYLHIPFCKHLCNYCDFYKRRWENQTSQLDEFHSLLQYSWIHQNSFLQLHNFEIGKLKSLYFGGGTPSLWGIEGAHFFKEKIKEWKFEFQKNYEWTMEVDPDAWDKESLSAWIDLGVNRVSIGTQAMDDDYLKILDRHHDVTQALELFSYLRSKDIIFSADLMIGVPALPKERKINDEIEILIKNKVSHISLYIMQTRSHYLHFNKLPDDEKIHDEYQIVINTLTKYGFHHYEVSNFSLPGFESIHNKQYWKMSPVAALGPSATGFIQTSKNEAIRYKWKVSEAQFLEEKLNYSQIELEKIYLMWRTDEWWKIKDFSFRNDYIQKVENLINEWVKSRYFERNGDEIRTTSEGFIILDTLIGRILGFLN